MGDLPRDPGHVVEQLSRSLQTLKDRLESLEHQLRVNVSNAVLPSDFREVLQRRLGELERQLLSKVAELEDEKSLLHNETSAHRQKTETALNALLQRVTELERGNSAFKSPDAFKVSLPLRTNYLYGKIKKTLPELYAFTICLWLRSSALPGIGTPFSYAVPGQANEIVLIEWGNNPIELLINDKVRPAWTPPAPITAATSDSRPPQWALLQGSPPRSGDSSALTQPRSGRLSGWGAGAGSRGWWRSEL